VDTEQLLRAQVGVAQLAAAAGALRASLAAQMMVALVEGGGYHDPARRGKLTEHADVLAGLAVDLADALLRRLQHAPSRV
jgi:hypothetical protein